MYEGIDTDKLYTSSFPNWPRTGLRGTGFSCMLATSSIGHRE
jgi:hypothetical protein